MMNKDKCKKAISHIEPSEDFNDRTIAYLCNKTRKKNKNIRTARYVYVGVAAAALGLFAIFALPHIIQLQSSPSPGNHNSQLVLETHSPADTPDGTQIIEPAKTPSVNANPDNTVSNISSVDKIKTYTSAEELYETATAVFTGQCLSIRPVYQNEMLYTLSEYKITELFKGEFQTGDIILLVEMGGITTYGEYAANCMPERKPGDGNWEDYHSPNDILVVRGGDGAYASIADDEVLLFAGDTSGFLESVSDPLYDPIGGIDGKFYKQQGDIYARALPASTDKPIFTGNKTIFGDAELSIDLKELHSY